MPALDANTLAMGLAWYVVFVFSTVLHEASHALVAHLGGDDTASRGGQVGLDPLPHMRREPYGMVLIPWISFFLNHWMMGWASAPYDPVWAERYPRRAARMALAGPMANFGLALTAGLVIRIGISQGWLTPVDMAGFASVAAGRGGDASGLAMLLSIAFSLNLLLGVFNLLPCPPLDGSSAVGLFLPEETARKWQGLMRQPQAALVGLLLSMVLFQEIGGRVFGMGVDLLYRGL